MATFCANEYQRDQLTLCELLIHASSTPTLAKIQKYLRQYQEYMKTTGSKIENIHTRLELYRQSVVCVLSNPQEPTAERPPNVNASSKMRSVKLNFKDLKSPRLQTFGAVMSPNSPAEVHLTENL